MVPVPTAIDVFAKDLLEVQFNTDLAVDAAFMTPSNWMITAEDVGIPVTVKSVIAGPGVQDTSTVLLEVTPFSIDEEYILTVSTSITASNGNSVDNTANTFPFVGRRTKTDSILEAQPVLYTRDPQSIYRSLLQTIGREDDLIGGTLSAFVPTPLVPPDPPVTGPAAFPDDFCPPSSPSAFDDEFTGTSLNLTKWTASGTITDATAPDILAQFADAELRYEVGRPRTSWITVQAGSDGVARGFYQDFGGEVPNGLHMIRVHATLRGAAVVADDARVFFGIYFNPGTFASREGCEIVVETDGGTNSTQILSQPVGGGSGTHDLGAGVGVSRILGTWGIQYEYFGIEKISTTVYRCWGWRPGAQMSYFTTIGYTGGETPTAVGFFFDNTSQTDPGNAVHYIDFYRYFADPTDII